MRKDEISAVARPVRRRASFADVARVDDFIRSGARCQVPVQLAIVSTIGRKPDVASVAAPHRTDINVWIERDPSRFLWIDIENPNIRIRVIDCAQNDPISVR
jgi:hypothetical protein